METPIRVRLLTVSVSWKVTPGAAPPALRTSWPLHHGAADRLPATHFKLPFTCSVPAGFTRTSFCLPVSHQDETVCFFKPRRLEWRARKKKKNLPNISQPCFSTILKVWLEKKRGCFILNNCSWFIPDLLHAVKNRLVTYFFFFLNKQTGDTHPSRCCQWKHWLEPSLTASTGHVMHFWDWSKIHSYLLKKINNNVSKLPSYTCTFWIESPAADISAGF